MSDPVLQAQLRDIEAELDRLRDAQRGASPQVQAEIEQDIARVEAQRRELLAAKGNASPPA